MNIKELVGYEDYFNVIKKEEIEMFKVVPGDRLEFDYVNWKGEKGHREVEVLGLYYGSNEFHPEEQWILFAFDIDKHAYRTFTMKDMSNVKLG